MSTRTTPPEPRSLREGPQGRYPISVYVNADRHRSALDAAFEVGPCSACCATGRAVNGALCTTCQGTKDVPLTEEQWRSDLCDEFSAGIQAAIDDLTKSLASHDQQLYPDEAMVQLAQRAQQAATNAAQAWRSSPDRRTVMQAANQVQK